MRGCLRPLSCLLLGAILVLGLPADGLPAGVVPVSATPTADCHVRLNDDPTAYPSVQAAVDASSGPGDVVKVAGHCAGVDSRGGFTQTVYLSRSLTLQGGYTTTNWTTPDPLAHPTTLDALGQGRVVYAAGQISLTIAGLRLTGGDATHQPGGAYGEHRGGGICAIEAAVAISGCTIVANTAEYGGGLYVYSGTVTLLANTVASNTAGFTGGGMLMNDGDAALVDNAFRWNEASTGGGLYLGAAAVTLTENVIADNVALFDGGGVIVEVYGSRSALSGNEIVRNRAGWNGGGLYFGEAVLACRAEPYVPHLFPAADPPSHPGARTMVAANLVSGNEAGQNGGGVFMGGDGGAAFLSGNHIEGNVAQADGGGVYLDWSADPTPLTGNSIVRNMCRRDGGGVYLGNRRATLQGNEIAENWSDRDGAGVCGWGAFLGNVFAANTAGGGGGGLYGGGTLEGNWFLENDAASGGGLYLGGGPAVLRNNCIAGNQAAAGSGLYLAGAAALAHNTIADNRVGDGCGMVVATDGGGTGAAVLTNTILFSNSVGLSVTAGSAATLTATLWGNGRDWGGAGRVVSGTINLWGDPAFHGGCHIGPASAARDAGVDAGVPVDIDGDPRPQGAGYDLGADEYSGSAWQVYLPLSIRGGGP